MLNIQDKDLAKLLSTTPQRLQKMKNDEYGSGRIIYSLLSSFSKQDLIKRIDSLKSLNLIPQHSYLELRDKAKNNGYKLNQNYKTVINGKEKMIGFEFVKEEKKVIKLIKFSKKLSEKDLIDQFFIETPNFKDIQKPIEITLVLNTADHSGKFKKLLELKSDHIQVQYFDEFYNSI